MIAVEARTREVENYLQGLIRDQLPFALSLGLNLLGQDFVETEQKGIELRFTVRRRGYILPSVKMQRGKKGAPDVRAYIDPERDILAKFELGGVRHPPPFSPRTVMGSWAIPIYLQATTEAGVIRQAYLPSNLGLASARRLGSEGSTEFTRAGLKGKRKTFVIPPGRSIGLPGGGIFRRTGRGRRDIEALYLLKPTVPIPPLLEFEKTGKQVAESKWFTHMTAALERALQTAR